MIHAFQRWWICPGTMERSRPGPLFAIEEYREEIEDSIRRHDVTVVCAPTSTGKTQKVPEYLLSWATDNGRAGKVFVTTPNRVAAQKASEFFNARFHAADSAAAVLARPRASFVLSGAGDASGDVVYATTGWLRAWLYPQATEMLRTKSWPLAALMVDECHTPDESRTMLLDLALMLLRGGVPVRLVVSSATANLGRLDASLTPGEGTPPARAPGWGLVRLQPPTFPVEVLYRPGAGVLDCVEECVSSLPGGCRGLVFLPGQGDIERAIELAAERPALRERCVLLPLYSDLPEEDQRLATGDGAMDAKHIVVVFSTNLTESSVTLDSLVFVVDSGTCKEMFVHPGGRRELRLVEISQSSAIQRRGRTGRQRPPPGTVCRCVRMYSKASLRARPEFATDEIDRNPLYGALLQSIGAGLDPHDLLRGQRTERILSDMAYLREQGLIEPAPSLFAGEGKDGSNPSGFRVTATGRVVVSLPLSVDAGRLLYLCLVGGARSVQLSDRSGWLLVVLACWLDLQARPFFVLSPAQFKRSAAQSAAFACYADYVRDVHERFHVRFSAGCDFHSALMVYVTMTEEIAAAVGGVRKWAAPSSNHMNAKVCAEWHRSVRRTLQALSRRLGLSRLERGAHWRFLDDEKGAAGRDEGLGDLIRAHTRDELRVLRDCFLRVFPERVYKPLGPSNPLLWVATAAPGAAVAGTDHRQEQFRLDFLSCYGRGGEPPGSHLFAFGVRVINERLAILNQILRLPEIRTEKCE